MSKKNKSTFNKQELWNLFDTEMKKDKPPLECIYPSIDSKDFCSTCNAILAFSEDGFLVCTNRKCAIIYRDITDHSAEWRYYGADDNQHADPARCGMPINPLLEESSYGCKIISFNQKMTSEMYMIKNYSEWGTIPYKEKQLYNDFQHITEMATNAGITRCIIDDALIYYKQIYESDVSFRGDNRKGLLAASIYMSCRKHKYPRTSSEIATMFKLDNTTSATKGYKNALKIINDLERNMDNEDKSKFCNTKPENFITPYCSKLELNSEITKLCFFVSKRIEQLNLMHENTPQSIASGIIFFVSQLYKLPHITKSRVKEVCKISEVTVGKCCNKMEAVADQLVPREILENIQRTSLLSNKSSSSKTSLTKTPLSKTPLNKTSFPPLVATPNEG